LIQRPTQEIIARAIQDAYAQAEQALDKAARTPVPGKENPPF
jgi:hypothetical protein